MPTRSPSRTLPVYHDGLVRAVLAGVRCRRPLRRSPRIPGGVNRHRRSPGPCRRTLKGAPSRACSNDPRITTRSPISTPLTPGPIYDHYHQRPRVPAPSGTSSSVQYSVPSEETARRRCISRCQRRVRRRRPAPGPAISVYAFNIVAAVRSLRANYQASSQHHLCEISSRYSQFFGIGWAPASPLLAQRRGHGHRTTEHRLSTSFLEGRGPQPTSQRVAIDSMAVVEGPASRRAGPLLTTLERVPLPMPQFRQAPAAVARPFDLGAPRKTVDDPGFRHGPPRPPGSTAPPQR